MALPSEKITIAVNLTGIDQNASSSVAAITKQTVVGTSLVQGPKGDKGDTGSAGSAGPGVATGGTTGQVLQKASGTNYDTSWHTLVKGDVGLGNVDNTSDANKPVSTATQTALDAKAAGAASATDNAIARFDGTTGKVIQNSVEAKLLDNGVLHLGPDESENPYGSARFQFADNTGSLSDARFTAYGGGAPTIVLTGAGGTAASPSDTTSLAQVGAIKFQKRASGTYTEVAHIYGYQDGFMAISAPGGMQLNGDDVMTVSATQTVTGKNLASGTNTFPTFNQNTTGSAATLTTSRTIGILTGDVTSSGSSFNGSANNTNATTLATVNSNVGSFTNANITVDAKGRITAASNGSGGSGSGITRNVSTITTSVTIGATASTDYVVFVGSGGAPTLPTAVGNTNMYTIKNVHTTNKTISTTSSQTIDGSTSATITPNTSLSLVSDGSNWKVV